MISDSCDILTSLNAGNEKSVLYVDSYYFKISPHTLDNMNYTTVWQSQLKQTKYFNFAFEFQFSRIDKEKFRFSCIRIPVIPISDDYYVLQLHCSINVFDQDPIVLVLHSYERMAYQIYDINHYRNLGLTSDAYTTELEIKVLVKMIEYDLSPAYKNQENEFLKMKEKFFNDETVLNELSYILRIPRVQDIFTGRQNDEFAGLKTALITRTATFSKEISDYIIAKDACCTMPLTDLGVILNYILNGTKTLISDEDLFQVYYRAHRMGLTFLVELSSDAILSKVGNRDFMIEALQVAEFVGDKSLFEKVVQKFHTGEMLELLNTLTLRRGESYGIMWRFMVQSLQRRLKRKESSIHVENGVSLQSSISKQFISLK